MENGNQSQYVSWYSYVRVPHFYVIILGIRDQIAILANVQQMPLFVYGIIKRESLMIYTLLLYTCDNIQDNGNDVTWKPHVRHEEWLACGAQNRKETLEKGLGTINKLCIMNKRFVNLKTLIQMVKLKACKNSADCLGFHDIRYEEIKFIYQSS